MTLASVLLLVVGPIVLAALVAVALFVAYGRGVDSQRGRIEMYRGFVESARQASRAAGKRADGVEIALGRMASRACKAENLADTVGDLVKEAWIAVRDRGVTTALVTLEDRWDWEHGTGPETVIPFATFVDEEGCAYDNESDIRESDLRELFHVLHRNARQGETPAAVVRRLAGEEA